MKKILLAEPQLDGNESKYLQDCIENNYISSVGDFVKKFEKKFSKYCNCNFGVSTTSGTSALHLALASIGISSMDEVILPTFTMIASANPIAYTGAHLKLVDSEPKTWNIDPTLIEKSITKKTKAIIPVHIYGHPVDMDPILEIAEKYNLIVIEDAAEAHGAKYKGKKVGGIGHIGCFSFYANKIITTGEGGMLVTNDKTIDENSRKLRNLSFDKDRKFKHDSISFNYRMTNLQAAVGLAQLERIEMFVSRRRQNAKLYNEVFQNIPSIVLPPEEKWAKNVYWMYSILIKNKTKNRDYLMKKLNQIGIESRVMFNPMHHQKPYKKFFSKSHFPVAEKLSKEGLNLPSGNNLDDEKITFIAEQITKIMS